MEMHTVEALRALPAGSNAAFKGVFVLKRADIRQTRTGKDFLSMELGDSSGSFRTNCWGDAAHYPALLKMAPGAILEVEGRLDYYNDMLSPKIQRVREIPPGEAEEAGYLDGLIASTPEDPEQLWAELQEAVSLIAPDTLRATVEVALEEHGESFRTSPAAISMHHAYRGGLLEHSVRMLRCARALLPHYSEVHPGLSLAGIVLHDVGKIHEYSQGLASGKTRDGILQGHVVLGYRIARKAALQARLSPELTERLEHIVLSHQGELEWGAAVKAATPEAVFVSMIDNLDAKMGMVQEALRKTDPDQEFSEFIPGLGSQLLVRALSASDEAPATGQEELGL